MVLPGNGSPSQPKGDVAKINEMPDNNNYAQSFATLIDDRFGNNTTMLFTLQKGDNNNNTLVSFVFNKENTNFAKIQYDQFNNDAAKPIITISPNGKTMAVLYHNPDPYNNNWYARIYNFDVNYEKLTYQKELQLQSSDLIENMVFSSDNLALYYLWKETNSTTLKEVVISSGSISTITLSDSRVAQSLTLGSDNKAYVPAKTSGNPPTLQSVAKLDRTTGSTVVSYTNFSPLTYQVLTGLCPVEIYKLSTPGADNIYARTIQTKQYELKDHLGNVTAVIDDYKTPVDNSNLYEGYTATVATSTNYYPFGMIMPGKNYNSGNYRFGFNGKENDNEVKGLGNQQDYGFRIYDPRIAKFLSVDPLFKEYPWYSTYHFAGNTPIWAIDLDGLEEEYFHKKFRNNAFYALLKIVNNTSKGEEFNKMFKNQTKYDIYYFPLESTMGEEGITTCIHSSIELDKLLDVDNPKSYYYQHVNKEDLSKSLSEGKSIILIGIQYTENYMKSYNETEPWLSIPNKENPAIKNTTFVTELASTIHHEKIAHILDVLLRKNNSEYQQHKNYNNRWGTTSPSNEELLTKPQYQDSQATKAIREIETYIKQNAE